MKALRITASNNSVPQLSVLDMLRMVKRGDSYHWALLELDGMGELPWDRIEKETARPQGMHVPYESLTELLSPLWDVWDCILVGSYEVGVLHKYSTSLEMFEACDIVLWRFDSSYWDVSMKDPAMLQRLTEALERSGGYEIRFVNVAEL